MPTPLLLAASKAEPLPGNLLSLGQAVPGVWGLALSTKPAQSLMFTSMHSQMSGGPASPLKGLIFNQKVQLEHLFFEKGTLLPRTYSTATGEALTHLQPAQRVVAPTTTNNLNYAVNDVGNFSFNSPVLPC